MIEDYFRWLIGELFYLIVGNLTHLVRLVTP